jgi:hypothetical protein
MKQLLPTMIVLSGFLMPSAAFAESAAVPAFGRSQLFSAEKVARGIPAPGAGYVVERNAAATRAWKTSLIPMVATQGLDIASSYGMRELNPLLAGADGRFGGKAMGIKVGTTAAVVGIEYLIVKKWPGAARMFSKLNWGSSVLTGAIAAHNFAIK